MNVSYSLILRTRDNKCGLKVSVYRTQLVPIDLSSIFPVNLIWYTNLFRFWLQIVAKGILTLGRHFRYLFYLFFALFSVILFFLFSLSLVSHSCCPNFSVCVYTFWQLLLEFMGWANCCQKATFMPFEIIAFYCLLCTVQRWSWRWCGWWWWWSCWRLWWALLESSRGGNWAARGKNY